MKSIPQIAREIGVTPQAVYKKVNNQLSTSLKPFLHKSEKGKISISIEGESLIKESFNKTSTSDVNSDSSDSQSQDNQMTSEFILFLQQQIKVKDEQIQEMLKQNQNMQVLLKQEQERTLLITELEDEEPKNITFWNKMFKKKV